jgi:hypothetical protein
VVIVDANNRTRDLSSGDSSTVFSFRLPDGASCPGDSANDDWRLQSFLVPANVDPGALDYVGIRPVGDGLHSLRRSDTRPWVHEFLAPNSGPGEPGVIVEPPPLIMGVGNSTGGLVDGSYRLGVVCTYDGRPDQYWDAQIEVTVGANGDTGFQAFEWELSPADPQLQESSDDSSGGGAFWPVAAAGTAVIVGVLVVRSRSRSPKAKETV